MVYFSLVYTLAKNIRKYTYIVNVDTVNLVVGVSGKVAICSFDDILEEYESHRMHLLVRYKSPDAANLRTA